MTNEMRTVPGSHYAGSRQVPDAEDSSAGEQPRRERPRHHQGMIAPGVCPPEYAHFPDIDIGRIVWTMETGIFHVNVNCGDFVDFADRRTQSPSPYRSLYRGVVKDLPRDYELNVELEVTAVGRIPGEKGLDNRELAFARLRVRDLVRNGKTLKVDCMTVLPSSFTRDCRSIFLHQI